jgi:DNA-directed RNA polymerase specialized sigma24 family protein
VSRIEESRGLLLDWARWKKSGGTAAENAAAAEIDAVVGTFPESIQSTLLVVYLGGGQMQDHVLRLGCPETTIARRLARADRLLLISCSFSGTSGSEGQKVRKWQGA